MRWWDVTRRQNMILIAPARSLQSNLVLICRGHSSQSTNSGHSQIFKQVRKPSSSPWGSESFWISSLHYCFVKRKFSNCMAICYKPFRLSALLWDFPEVLFATTRSWVSSLHERLIDRNLFCCCWVKWRKTYLLAGTKQDDQAEFSARQTCRAWPASLEFHVFLASPSQLDTLYNLLSVKTQNLGPEHHWWISAHRAPAGNWLKLGLRCYCPDFITFHSEGASDVSYVILVRPYWWS